MKKRELLEIIEKAMYYSALVYAKGMENYTYLWEDRKTIFQQADDIAEMLNAMGYRLVKSPSLTGNRKRT
jgi:hypothetical protein